MENTGMYFVGRCSSPNCAYYNAFTTLYIGCGKTFDFVKERRQCMCGQCFAAISEILYVFFYKCKWSFTGQLLSTLQRFTEPEHCTAAIEYFPQDKQLLNWKWLKFTVSDDAVPQRMVSQATQTLGELRGACVSVQTDFQDRTSQEDPVISCEVVDSLIRQAQHYEEKYRNLKEAAEKKYRC